MSFVRHLFRMIERWWMMIRILQNLTRIQMFETRVFLHGSICACPLPLGWSSSTSFLSREEQSTRIQYSLLSIFAQSPVGMNMQWLVKCFILRYLACVDVMPVQSCSISAMWWMLNAPNLPGMGWWPNMQKKRIKLFISQRFTYPQKEVEQGMWWSNFKTWKTHVFSEISRLNTSVTMPKVPCFPCSGHGPTAWTIVRSRDESRKGKGGLALLVV